MNKASVLKGYLYVILSAVLFGTMPLMANLIYDDGVTPLCLVFLRNALSVPMLAVLAYALTGSLKITPKALPSLATLAVMGCCITPMLLFSSYTYIDSGTATVFHFIYPGVVVVAQLAMRKTKFSWGNTLSLLLCIAGIVLFYDPSQKINGTGSAIALLSGVSYALYIMFLSGFKYKEISGFTFSFYIALICTVVMALVCTVSANLTFPVSLKGWVLSLLFAASVNVGAVVLFQRGTFIIGGERASILSTFEPITSVLAGTLILGEVLVPRTVIGTLLVVSASVVIGVCDIINNKNRQKNIREAA